MRLAKLSEFRSLFFTPGRAPSSASLRARIDKGRIPGGRKLGDRGGYIVRNR